MANSIEWILRIGGRANRSDGSLHSGGTRIVAISERGNAVARGIRHRSCRLPALWSALTQMRVEKSQRLRDKRRHSDSEHNPATTKREFRTYNGRGGYRANNPEKNSKTSVGARKIAPVAPRLRPPVSGAAVMTCGSVVLILTRRLPSGTLGGWAPFERVVSRGLYYPEGSAEHGPKPLPPGAGVPGTGWSSGVPGRHRDKPHPLQR